MRRAYPDESLPETDTSREIRIPLHDVGKLLRGQFPTAGGSKKGAGDLVRRTPDRIESEGCEEAHSRGIRQSRPPPWPVPYGIAMPNILFLGSYLGMEAFTEECQANLADSGPKISMACR